MCSHVDIFYLRKTCVSHVDISKFDHIFAGLTLYNPGDPNLRAPAREPTRGRFPTAVLTPTCAPPFRSQNACGHQSMVSAEKMAIKKT
jgi:hypothetical protein